MNITKLLLLAFFLALVSTANAQKTAAPSTKDLYKIDPDSWFVQFNGNLDLPTGALANNFKSGYGGEGSVGFHFSHQFEISLESGFDIYGAPNGANNYSWNMVPLVLKVQLGLTHHKLRPYVFAAAGLAFNSKVGNFATSNVSTSETDFLSEAGVGLSFYLEDSAILFMQAEVQLDNTSSTYALDTPTILIPLSLGIKFQLDTGKDKGPSVPI